MARKALGRGLGALIGDQEPETPTAESTSGEMIQEVAVSSVVPSSLQPRKEFSAEQLEELSASIRERGIIQPLIVRPQGNKFELIAGERRWRAARNVGLKVVPVISRKATDDQVLEMALVENLQRADLNPIEEAEGYARLVEGFQLTQEEVSRRVGKSRAAVANALRLLSLAPAVLNLVKNGQLSVGHGKVLLGVQSSKQQEILAGEIVRRSLSVRQTENLLKSGRAGKNSTSQKKSKSPGADWRDLEQQIQRSLGAKARLVGTQKKGKLEIFYYDADDLDRVLSALGISLD